MKSTFIQHISQLPKYGTGISFERLTLAITQLLPQGIPDSDKVIVITGTNGKGSTSMLCESLLRHHGHDTALFTSPHFIEFNERFKINGIPLDYQQLNQQLEQVIITCQAIEKQLEQQFGVFEILTLLALRVFSGHKTDVMIFEAGIGGRYDPTRLLQSPLTALTSLDLDHTEILGDTLELIAYDKLDSCTPHGTTVLGNITESLRQKLHIYAKLRALNLVNSDKQFQATSQQLGKLTVNDSKTGLSTSIQTRLTTSVDILNIQTALSLSQLWLDSHQQTFDHQAMIKALEQCQLPGRFESICQQPEVIVDAAHTPAAYRLLIDTIKTHYSDKPLILLVGLTQGRNASAFAQQLASFNNHNCKHIIITQAFKGIDCEELSQAFNLINKVPIKTYSQNQLAYQSAKQLAQSNNARILVIGGLFLAAEITAIERGIDTKQLFLY